MKVPRLPRLQAEPLQRPRLVEALLLAHERRCIVLTAPAGAGKSALLRSWSRRARTGQVHVVHVTPVDGLLSVPLAAQCAALEPALAGALEGPVHASEEEALATIAIAIVRHERLLARPLAFVFDQLQDMRDAMALQGLQPLLDYCPPRMQCLFASRGPVALSLGRLREHGELLELDADDLRWTEGEAHALVRSMLDESAAPRTAQWLAQTEGWSMGLASICRAVRAGRPDGELQAQAFMFLEQQVMAQLPASGQRLLQALAAMEVFDDALAARLHPDRERGSAFPISGLVSCGFIHPVDGSRMWRFQASFAGMLRRRFDALPAAERRRLHRRASAYFADAGLQWHAVRQAVLGGDAKRAAALVEHWAPALFQEGRHDELAALVRLVPAPASARSPLLRLWLALVALLEHRYGECRDILAALERDIPLHDAAARRRMRVLKGWLAVFRDDMEAAKAMFPSGDVTSEDARIDDITLAGERNVLSWIHIYRNDYQRAREVQAAASAGAPLGTLFGALSGRCLAGLSLALEGRMAHAERIYRGVLEEAKACGAPCIDPAMLATGLLGETLYELNDLAGVLALQPRLPELERRSLPDPFLRIVLVMLRSHAVLGDLGEAMRHAELLDRFARGRGLDRLLSYALFERIRLSLLLQDPEAARPAWSELAALRKSHAAGEGTALAEVAMVADRAEILLLFYRGRLELARAQVDELLRVSARRGRHRRVAALHFQRAAIDRELGAEASAQDHALRGLALGARLGLVRSLVDAHPTVPQLLEGAMRLHGPDEALAFHADRLRAAAGAGPLVAIELGAAARRQAPRRPVTPPLASLSEREAQIAKLLALALPNKEIARELGLSPETVKWHLHNLYAKLGVTTRFGAVSLLRRP